MSFRAVDTGGRALRDDADLSARLGVLHCAETAVAMLRIAVGALGRIGVPVAVARDGDGLLLRVTLEFPPVEDVDDDPDPGPVVIEDARPAPVMAMAADFGVRCSGRAPHADDGGGGG